MGRTVRRGSEAGHLAILNREDRSCRPKCSSSASIGGNPRKLKFGPFELSSRERVLRHEGVVLPLGGRSLDILINLAEGPGEIVAEKELRDRAWSAAAIEEARLRVHMRSFGRRLVSVNSEADISQTSREGPTRSSVLSSVSNSTWGFASLLGERPFLIGSPVLCEAVASS